MANVEISVRGSHVVRAQAEIGIVHGRVAATDESLGAAYDEVGRAVEQVTRSLRGLEGGAVTRWAVHGVQTWTDHHGPHGRERPLHRAVAELQAEFSDRPALSAWLRHMSHVPGFEVGHVAWALGEETRARLRREATAGAMRDARARAQDYAAALGLSTVEVVAVTDPGSSAQPMAAVAMAREGVAHAPVLELSPAEVEVRAEVDARFVAS